MILFPAKRKLRKLAKSLVETHLQYVPWTTVNSWDDNLKRGLVRSDDVVLGGRKFRVSIEHDAGFLTVYVMVNDHCVYPGGEYTVYWLGNPWRWEWHLAKKVFADREVKVVPTNNARDILIEILDQGAPTKVAPTAGQLTLVPKSVEEMTPQEMETQV